MGKGKHYPPGNRVFLPWKDTECSPSKENNSPLKALAGPGPSDARFVQQRMQDVREDREGLTLTVCSDLSFPPPFVSIEIKPLSLGREVTQ